MYVTSGACAHRLYGPRRSPCPGGVLTSPQCRAHTGANYSSAPRVLRTERKVGRGEWWEGGRRHPFSTITGLGPNHPKEATTPSIIDDSVV